MKTKIDIISGFLGAGKTTLIQKLMDELKHDEKIAIIENEFGAMSIDGKLLKESTIYVREINSGCICCSLSGDFEAAVNDIMNEYKPHRIIIEPSGVAKLSEIISAIKNTKINDLFDLNIVGTIVDGTKFKVHKKNFGAFYENQIMHGSVIYLNRTNRMEPAQLEEVMEEIRKMNPMAKILITPLENIKESELIGISVNESRQDGRDALGAIKVALSRKHNTHKAEDVFQVWGKAMNETFKIDQLKNIMNHIFQTDTLGSIIRAKGIVNTDEGWKKFDFVPNEFIIEDYSVGDIGRICVIGLDLDKIALSKIFQEVTIHEEN